MESKIKKIISLIPGLNSKNESKKLIYIYAYLLVIGTLICLLIAPAPAPAPVPQNDIILKQEQKIEFDYTKLHVKSEYQDMYDNKGNQKMVIFINNDSEYVITGDIKIRFKDMAGNTVNTDTIYFENINPYTGTYAVMWINPFKAIGFTYQPYVKNFIKP